MKTIKHKKLRISIKKYVNSPYYGTCYRVGIFEFGTYKALLSALRKGELDFYSVKRVRINESNVRSLKWEYDKEEQSYEINPFHTNNYCRLRPKIQKGNRHKPSFMLQYEQIDGSKIHVATFDTLKKAKMVAQLIYEG